MPDPSFQPLTMSPEEWDDCTLRGRPSMIKKLKAEVLAHAQAAAQLVQALEKAHEREDVAAKSCKELWRDKIETEARAEQAEAALASLRARLHEIEQEREQAR